jgi:SAM-dependent methyltransferase
LSQSREFVETPPYIFRLTQDRNVAHQPVLDIGDRWKELLGLGARARGFVLIPGEELATESFVPTSGYVVHVRTTRVIEDASSDGMDLVLAVVSGEAVHDLAQLHLGNEQRFGDVLSMTCCLDPFEGVESKVVVRCEAGRSGIADGDWAGVIDMVVAPSDRVGRALASAHSAWRTGNELASFADVYSHPLYQPRRNTLTVESAPTAPIEEVLPNRHRPGRNALPVEAIKSTLGTVTPRPGELPYLFAKRLLDALLPCHPPDFAGHLRALSRERTHGNVRMLSLCSGAARIETEIVTAAGVPVDLTLVDINADLLAIASASMPPGVACRAYRGDATALASLGGEYDVIVIVSGLHHLPELEQVLSGIGGRLASGGEFWLISEQVGRNGNRLWPEDYAAANSIFRELPHHLRVNRNTGTVDVELPNIDLSLTSFEGIRSEEIPGALARYFRPIVEDRRDCFLWRFIDLAYQENYRLDQAADVDTLRNLVLAEFSHWAEGGFSCELNGIYRSKLAPAPTDAAPRQA